jgi:pimeloyl-ACP methyl ester carboxylesterase
VAQVVKGPGGRGLAVEISGAPPGKPVVFLLHGTPGTLSGPKPRGIFLHRRGVRLVTYNRPGYPDSDRDPGRTVASAADDIKAIADHFKFREFSVIGRSGGAPHALACGAAPSLAGRVKCIAALSSLAPYGADGLNWFSGMAGSNVRAYSDVMRNLPALIDTLHQHADEVRNNSQGLLNALWPELDQSDKQVIGDIALRRIIAETHAEALRESISGWVDDVIALGGQWNFEVKDIKVPVLLWHGEEDVFSPPAHTRWLAERIDNSEYYLPPNAAHFGAVEILPEIINWVLGERAGAIPRPAPATSPAPALSPARPGPRSERLGIDHAQQPAFAASGADVRMPRPQ